MSTEISDPRKRKYEEAFDKQAEEKTKLKKDNESTSEFSKEHLQLYYEVLFPYEEVYDWLSYFDSENGKYWRNREFSFTTLNDTYSRFNSYNGVKEFKDDIKRICPLKIDIGAVYNVEPSRKQSVSQDKFVVEEKELVFDIDISDYDNVRTCCRNEEICEQCWPLMACAIRVISRTLKEDFGFQHLLWVFSGRRGIHCWVGDALARRLDTSGRSAIVEYLKTYNGNSQNAVKVDLGNNLHECLRRAYDVCIQYFQRVTIEKQTLLNDPKGIAEFVAMIRNDKIRDSMKTALHDDMSNTNGKTKLERINQVWNTAKQKYTSPKEKQLIEANRYECVFACTYPRLDVNVSKHVNHLLKCPFVVHPKTGRVCTIIDPDTCDHFNPNSQPVCFYLAIILYIVVYYIVVYYIVMCLFVCLFFFLFFFQSLDLISTYGPTECCFS
ncbi:DNA primase [Reticulomyxa filosa]|uniref:DNA primase n=1 Tax=Reticulomyxa filosa TaxID=46433 RepID=X6PCH5_RETFI|nr:DNA primase [Reticulomyxa filosa]|eukprot:ETO35808.1 DNA primase [Reticulomyxa filosa]